MRVVREFLLSLRQRGIRIRAFPDDWLILADSRERCAPHVATAVEVAQSLGFRLNWAKSDWFRPKSSAISPWCST